MVENYLHKGIQVYIEGKLITRKWQDQNGQYQYVTEILVDAFSGKMKILNWHMESNEKNQLKNCKFKNKCSKTWESLIETKTSDIKYCPDCESSVHLCKSESSVIEAINKDWCIAVNIMTKNELLGFPTKPDGSSHPSSDEADDLPFF